MLFGLFVIALMVTCVPIAAAVVVTVASRREDADWTLNGAAAPGPARGLARQILDFHSEVPEWPRPKNHARIRAGVHAPRSTRVTEPRWRPEEAKLRQPARVTPRSAADAR